MKDDSCHTVFAPAPGLEPAGLGALRDIGPTWLLELWLRDRSSGSSLLQKVLQRYPIFVALTNPTSATGTCNLSALADGEGAECPKNSPPG